LAISAIVFLFYWLLTYFIGAAKVRQEVIASMPLRPFSSFTDVSQCNSRAVEWIYYCRTTTCAPFLVYVEYGWRAGPETGDGGSAIDCWIFGGTFRVWTLSDWLS
jgi:hypothetical protein